MEHQSHWRRSGIIAAVVSIILSAILANIFIGFLALFLLMSATAGKMPDWFVPATLSFSILAPMLLVAVALFPVMFFWKAHDRWKHIFLYILSFIIIVPLVVTGLQFIGRRRIESGIRQGVANVGTFQRSLYGRWETSYKGEPLIVEFAVGDNTDETYTYLSNGGVIRLYRPGIESYFEKGGFILADLRPGLHLTLSSSFLRDQKPRYFINRQGEVKNIAPDRFEFHAQDFNADDPTNPGPVQIMVFTRMN